MEQENKKELVALWVDSFGDSKQYTEYYFYEKDTNGIPYLEYEDEKLVSMLFCNPYRLRFCGKTQNAVFIVGVATEPEYRRKGYMRKLLLQAMKDRREAGECFIYLEPAKEEIYLAFGFRGVYYRKSKKTIFPLFLKDRLKRTVKPYVKCSEEEKEKVVVFANAWQEKNFDFYVERDRTYYDNLELELNMVHGRIMVGFHKGEVCYICNYWKSIIQTEIREYIGDYFLPGLKEQKKRPAIMVRILNLEKVLNALPKDKRAFIMEEGEELEVQDGLLEENSGIYFVNEKGCIEKKVGDGKEKKVISIEEITDRIFKVINTYINDIT